MNKLKNHLFDLGSLNSNSQINCQLNKKFENKNIKTKSIIATVISNKIINKNFQKIKKNYNKELIINNSNKINIKRYFHTRNHTKDYIETNKDSYNKLNQFSSLSYVGNNRYENLNFIFSPNISYRKKFNQ